MEKTGDLVRRRREELGLSQEDLARLLAYKHKTSINKIEMGKAGIPRAKLPDFARILGVDIAALAASLAETRLRAVEARLRKLEEDEDALEAEIRERAAQSAVVPEVAVRAWLRSFRSGDITDPAFRKRLADVLVGPEDVTIVYNAKEAPYGPGEGSHSASSRGGQVTAYKPVVIGPLIFFRLPRQ